MWGRDVLGAQERAAEVGPDDFVPELLLHIADARPAGESPEEVGDDRSVVHQDVDSPELLHRRVDERLHLLLGPDVGRHGERLHAPLLNLPLDGVERNDVGDDDIRSGIGERLGDMPADPSTASCDYGNFAVHHDWLLPCEVVIGSFVTAPTRAGCRRSPPRPAPRPVARSSLGRTRSSGIRRPAAAAGSPGCFRQARRRS